MLKQCVASMLCLFSGVHQEQTTGFRHPKAPGILKYNYLPENQVKHSGVYLKSLS